MMITKAIRTTLLGIVALGLVTNATSQPASAAAGKWHRVASGADGSVFYVEPTATKPLRNGDPGQFAFRSKILHGSQEFDGVKIARSFSTDRVDCSTRRYATGPSEFFDASGRKLLSITEVSEWRPIIPNSTIEDLAKYVCSTAKVSLKQ